MRPAADAKPSEGPEESPDAPTPPKPKGKGEKWQYESEIAANAAKLAARKTRRANAPRAAGKARVFHGSDVEGGATLRGGGRGGVLRDPARAAPGSARGRAGGGKDPQARAGSCARRRPRRRRGRRSPRANRQAPIRSRAHGRAPRRHAVRAGAGFRAGVHAGRHARVLHGQRQGPRGGGARAAISKLKLDAAPFAAPGSRAGRRRRMCESPPRRRRTRSGADFLVKAYPYRIAATSRTARRAA